MDEWREREYLSPLFLFPLRHSRPLHVLYSVCAELHMRDGDVALAGEAALQHLDGSPQSSVFRPQ